MFNFTPIYIYYGFLCGRGHSWICPFVTVQCAKIMHKFLKNE